jgi:hypothetical protein
MSAYIVDKNHVIYLVDAAMNSERGASTFRWYSGERPNYNRGELPKGDYDRAAEVANMLWRENIKSVSHRYPHESSATLPGPIDHETIEPRDFRGIRWLNFAPVQVIKACHCFNYQSCEHDAWEASEAKAFIESLISSYCHSLQGYDDAEWGAPAVYGNARNVVCLTDLMKGAR